jgi:hypothetical protein
MQLQNATNVVGLLETPHGSSTLYIYMMGQGEEFIVFFLK